MSDDKLLKDIVDSLIEERKSDKKFKFLTRSIFFVFITNFSSFHHTLYNR